MTLESPPISLGDRLIPVFADEPPLDDPVTAVFAHAGRLHRRRSRIVLTSGAVVVTLVTFIAYALTTVMLPNTPQRTTYIEPVATVITRHPDQAVTLLAPILSSSGMKITPRDHGDGWRQYDVQSKTGRPHGLIELSVYDEPDGLCFPVLADRTACARPETTPANVQYARYAFDRDVNWQVNETMARRLPDGRTLVIQATGERGTGSPTAGRPPVTALLTARLAVDPRLMAAFAQGEHCNGPSPDCPTLKVPVPVVN
jgi:hypothetical protein